MTGIQHKEMAAGRWWELTLAEQLGHVGSEVSRAIRWKSRNAQIAQGALHRALELIDLTLADGRWRGSVARLREIARAREVLVDTMEDAPCYESAGTLLQRYFDAYAVASRRKSGTHRN